MAKGNTQANNLPPPSESQDEATTQLETILQDILETMHYSDVFPPVEKDTPSRFWSACENKVKQYDNEWLNRHNSDMDVLLIFAGLFSAVSAAFIVNMESSLTTNPSDTTNALLKMLINTMKNGTFSEQDASLPVWPGPTPTDIWVQTLAYTSLSTSLLAAFGAGMAKRWLAYFKISRFEECYSAEQRCKRRQQKVNGLKVWHFSTVIATFPILLQLSLFFFGIALAAHIWTQQHTVASVIIGTTTLGVVFYLFAVLASLKWPDCPFQTPGWFHTALQKPLNARILEYLSQIAQTMIAHFLQYLSETTQVLHSRSTLPMARTQARGGLLTRLQNSLIYGLDSTQDMITRSISHARFMAQIALAYMQGTEVSMDASAGSEAIVNHSIQWILETSTDADIITAAVGMVPEVEWPEQSDISDLMERLNNHLYACFDSTRQLPSLSTTQARVVACLKAICHLCVEQGVRWPFYIDDSGIFSYEHNSTYEIPRLNQGLFIAACAQGTAIKLDIESLSPTDRMWMAHMFTYGLHKKRYDPQFDTFVIDFIERVCLLDSTPAPRLVADCLLSAGQLLGLQIDRQHLVRRDKSAAISSLRNSVLKRLLNILSQPLLEGMNEPRIEERHTQNARKLLPSFQYLGRQTDRADDAISNQCLKLSFHFLEEAEVSGLDIRFKNVATLLRLSLFYSPRSSMWGFLHQDGSGPEWIYWLGQPDWHTSAQFDLLVDYLMRAYEDTDYDAIGDAFVVLAALHGSPSTLERKRLYIDTIIQCMGQEVRLSVRLAALNAACMVRTEVASMGRDDGSLRYRFSQALASAVRPYYHSTQEQYSSQFYNPVKDRSFFDDSEKRDRCYLRLLCTLVPESTWHRQLERSGHFDNCLLIARTLSPQDMVFKGIVYKPYAVHVAHIFAVVDDLGEEHSFLEAVQTYPSWPLILTSWRYIFCFDFFEKATSDDWKYIASTGYLESLQPLVKYAKRYRERWDNGDDTRRLIDLVERVGHLLDEQAVTPSGRGQEDSSIWHREIPELGKQIRQLLRASEGHDVPYLLPLPGDGDITESVSPG